MALQDLDSQESQTTFENEKVSVKVTKKPNCQVKLDIVGKLPFVQASYQKAIKLVSKEVSIPGFRKGKAPQTVILENFGRAINKEFERVVLEDCFKEAIKLANLKFPSEQRVKPEIREIKMDKEASISIEMEVYPTMTPIDIHLLKIEKVIPPALTEEERHNAIRNTLLRFATYEPIEDREVRVGDFVDFTVELLKDPPVEVIKNQRTQVNDTGMPSWIREKVIGLKAEESAEGMTGQDDHLVNPDPEFVSQPFRVTVHAIWQGIVPALDDEFAKKVGLNTVEEFYNKIDEVLQKEIEEEAFHSEVVELEKQLLQKFSFDVPESLIELNMNHWYEKFNEREEEIDLNEREFEEIESNVRNTFIKKIQLNSLYQAIAKKHRIEINQDDVNQEFMYQLNLHRAGRGQLDLGEKENFQNQIQLLAMQRKVQEFLIGKATQ